MEYQSLTFAALQLHLLEDLRLRRAAQLTELSIHDLVYADRTALAQCDDASWAALRRLRNLLCPMTANREMQRARELGIHIVGRDDQHFPALLREIPDPPFALYVRGDISGLNHGEYCAIVGARKATEPHLNMCTQWAHALLRSNITLLSGLAFGVDAAVHRACIHKQRPTYAVLASGVDDITPRTHSGLGRSIIEQGGALLSEYRLGTPALAHHYPERNRLISGCAHAVLIAGCRTRSGTMHTARHAMEQGRPVLAIPGDPQHWLSEGPHALIRDGALLVRNPDDIIDVVQSQVEPSFAGRAQASARQSQKGDAMGPGSQADLLRWLKAPRSLHEVVQRIGGSPADAMATLTQLELSGQIVQEAQGYKTRYG